MINGESSYRRFLDGDRNGLAEIIRDYKDGLILYINNIVNDIHIAEDITEDTFVKLYTDKPVFDGKSSFKTWLFSVGRYTAIGYMRKNKLKYEVSADEQANISDEMNIEQSYIDNEDKRKLRQSIKKLNSEYRQVLYLTYYEDFSREDTAKIMKKTIKQVSDLLYRAKNTLKSELERDEKYENL